MPFSSLPPEIINSHLLLFLDADDILNLSKCINLEINKQVYEHSFHDDTEFSHYDLKMFTERARAQIYVTGRVRHGVFKRGLPPVYERIRDHGVSFLRMHSGWKVPTKDLIISEVNAGRDSVSIIDSRGNVYFAAPADDAMEDPYKMVKGDTRQDTDHGETERSGTVPSGVVEFSEKLFNAPYKPTRFVSIRSGWETVALDDSGVLWRRAAESQFMTPFCLVNIDTEKVITERILKVSISEAFSACLVEGVGVVTWDMRALGTLTPNGTKNGYCCRNGLCCHVWVIPVPDTKNIKDFVLVSNFMVVLLDDGSARGFDFDLRNVAYREVDWMNTEERFDGHFLKVAGSGSQFALLSEDRLSVLWGQLSGEDEHSWISGVESNDRIRYSSLAVGDHHFWVLCENGMVITAGKEMGLNGCLGLGRLNDAKKISHIGFENDGHTIKLDSPVVIDMPRRAYGVFAAKDYSVTLI